MGTGIITEEGREGTEGEEDTITKEGIGDNRGEVGQSALDREDQASSLINFDYNTIHFPFLCTVTNHYFFTLVSNVLPYIVLPSGITII